MTEIKAAQPIETQGYTLPELRWKLSRVRGKRLPDRTLRHWLTMLCIEPNQYGLYSDQDLQLLTRLVFWLRRCHSIDKFRQLLIKEFESYAS